MSISIFEILNVVKDDIQDNKKILKDKKINSFKIDSREVRENDAFIALLGSNVDGYDYIDDAIQNGACLVITNRSHKSPLVLSVRDSVKSLGLIANYYIKKINPISVGITGTNGKSTVTAMTASIAQYSCNTARTLGNYNNQIGLPLSVLAADIGTEIFVLEMGASKIGDIRELTTIVEPKIVALLNVSSAHIDTFGNLENVYKAKEELLEDQGYEKTVILNKDDENFPKWQKKASRHHIITISKRQDSDYRLVGKSLGKLIIKTKKFGIININTNSHEDYMVTNILFSIACASESGVDARSIKKGIENFILPNGRFTVLNGHNNSKIIDSSYNANPESFKAAIDSFVTRESREKWLIMGQMGELGEASKDHHIAVARYAESKKIDRIFLISDHAEEIEKTVKIEINVFKSKQDLIQYILPMLKSNVDVLIKASRYMKFESIVESLRE
tara:strand:- start:2047 stop:3390 length:1344 start_codon:yes stop_codon:yes gene_type:complete